MIVYMCAWMQANKQSPNYITSSPSTIWLIDIFLVLFSSSELPLLLLFKQKHKKTLAKKQQQQQHCNEKVIVRQINSSISSHFPLYAAINYYNFIYMRIVCNQIIIFFFLLSCINIYIFSKTVSVCLDHDCKTPHICYVSK